MTVVLGLLLSTLVNFYLINRYRDEWYNKGFMAGADLDNPFTCGYCDEPKHAQDAMCPSCAETMGR